MNNLENKKNAILKRSVEIETNLQNLTNDHHKLKTEHQNLQNKFHEIERERADHISRLKEMEIERNNERNQNEELRTKNNELNSRITKRTQDYFELIKILISEKSDINKISATDIFH